jgi:hypothetical protein
LALVSGKPALLYCGSSEQRGNAVSWEELQCGKLWFSDDQLVSDLKVTDDPEKEHHRRTAMQQQARRLANGVKAFEENINSYKTPASTLTASLNSPKTSPPTGRVAQDPASHAGHRLSTQLDYFDLSFLDFLHPLVIPATHDSAAEGLAPSMRLCGFSTMPLNAP